MKNGSSVSSFSIITLILSIIGVILYYFVLSINSTLITFLFVVISLIAIVLPPISKKKSLEHNQGGRALEIIAIVISGFNFYCIIFALTKWPIGIAYIGWLVCSIVYSQIKGHRKKDAFTNTLHDSINGATQRMESTVQANVAEHFDGIKPTYEKDSSIYIDKQVKAAESRKLRFCRKCGAELSDDSVFCSQCGQRIE